MTDKGMFWYNLVLCILAYILKHKVPNKSKIVDLAALQRTMHVFDYN